MPRRTPPRKTKHRRSKLRKSKGTASLGLIAFGAGIALYMLLAQTMDWQPYVVWLAAWGVTTFIFCALDTPLTSLYVLILVGGVVGGWAGMLFFRPKALASEFKFVLLAATILHGAIALGVLSP